MCALHLLSTISRGIQAENYFHYSCKTADTTHLFARKVTFVLSRNTYTSRYYNFLHFQYTISTYSVIFRTSNRVSFSCKSERRYMIKVDLQTKYSIVIWFQGFLSMVDWHKSELFGRKVDKTFVLLYHQYRNPASKNKKPSC